jgi:ATP-dependent DNA ligase
MEQQTLQQQFPVLYGEAVNSKTKMWDISVFTINHIPTIITKHGYIDGKIQTNHKVIDIGKNIGKSNYLSPLQNAVNIARSLWVKKKESGYVVQGHTVNHEKLGMHSAPADEEDDNTNKNHNPSNMDVPSVMLAHDFNKKENHIKFPCFVQRKFDGTRCVSIPNVGLFSRNKKKYPHLDHITQEINLLPTDIILDGELYSESISFQEIVGIVKRQSLLKDDVQKQMHIKLFVYDIINDQPYHKRYQSLIELFQKYKFKHLVLVNSDTCASKEEMMEKHALYVEQGYEGIMLRNKNGLYKGTRTNDLQKYKQFMDDEYKVIGYEEGNGLEKGAVIWVCENKYKVPFRVRPRGTREMRQEQFVNGENYIGKMLTVRFQELTNDGLPRFPVGIAFRDYE